MNITEIAAYWGAVVATLAFCWNVFQWFSTRANVIVDLIPGPTPLEDPSKEFSEKIGIINRGGARTTITEAVFWFTFKSGAKTERRYVSDLPKVLESGEIHTFYAATRTETAGDTVHLHVWVYHSRKSMPVKQSISMILLDANSYERYVANQRDDTA